MKMRLFISVLIIAQVLCGQEPDRNASGSVRIVTEPSGGDVYVDSLFVGRSPVELTTIEPGRHVIRAFYPSVFAWDAIVVRDSIELPAGGRVERTLAMGTVLRIQSEPPGGLVTYGNTLLGPTPLYVRLDPGHRGNLMMKKAGYDSLEIRANQAHGGLIRVRLTPLQQGETGTQFGDLLPGDGPVATDHWPTYTSAASMIVAGVAAAYFKDQANREFDRYMQTNDPARLSSTRQLDRWAAVTLVVSQISFGVLTYFLLSD